MRASFNWKLSFVPAEKKKKRTTTNPLALQNLCFKLFLYRELENKSLQGNKPNPAEARVSKSVGLIYGHLKHPQFVLRLAQSCVTPVVFLSFGR